MDILFITNTDINDCTFGGGKGARSCYELLCRIGKTDIQVIKKQSSFCSALSVLQGYYPPLTGKEIEKTKRACRKKKPDVVFLNTSVYGAIAKANDRANYTARTYIWSCFFYARGTRAPAYFQ